MHIESLCDGTLCIWFPVESLVCCENLKDRSVQEKSRKCNINFSIETEINSTIAQSYVSAQSYCHNTEFSSNSSVSCSYCRDPGYNLARETFVYTNMGRWRTCGRGKSENRLETFFQCNLSHQYTERAVPSIGKFCGSYSICSSCNCKTAVLDLSDSIRAGVETSTGRGNSGNNDKCINRVPGCLRTQRECKNCQAMSKLYGKRTVSLCTELVSSMYFEMVDQSKPNQA